MEEFNDREMHHSEIKKIKSEYLLALLATIERNSSVDDEIRADDRRSIIFLFNSTIITWFHCPLRKKENAMTKTKPRLLLSLHCENCASCNIRNCIIYRTPEFEKRAEVQ